MRNPFDHLLMTASEDGLFSGLDRDRV